MIDISSNLTRAISDYFREQLGQQDKTEASLDDVREYKGKSGDNREFLIEMQQQYVVTELPPIVVLSIAERVAALACALEGGIAEQHAFPENWTTASFTDMQHGNGGSYLGVAYINSDTGLEFMIERDGKQYWL